MLLCYKNSCSLHIDGPVDIIPHGKKIEHLPHDACAATASPWPPIDTVQKLLEAADILLDQCNYDGHGWELIDTARDVARAWVDAKA